MPRHRYLPESTPIPLSSNLKTAINSLSIEKLQKLLIRNAQTRPAVRRELEDLLLCKDGSVVKSRYAYCKFCEKEYDTTKNKDMECVVNSDSDKVSQGRGNHFPDTPSDREKEAETRAKLNQKKLQEGEESKQKLNKVHELLISDKDNAEFQDARASREVERLLLINRPCPEDMMAMYDTVFPIIRDAQKLVSNAVSVVGLENSAEPKGEEETREMLELVEARNFLLERQLERSKELNRRRENHRRAVEIIRAFREKFGYPELQASRK